VGTNMKRILFLSLILLFLFLLTTVVFSADDIDDPLAPLSPDIVTNDRYKPFDEELIPESPPVIDIEDDEIPEALPQTGGIPAEAFYIAGGVCILSAILILTTKSKSTDK
jgi:LPXTG-motif cell wall-anchored protein